MNHTAIRNDARAQDHAVELLSIRRAVLACITEVTREQGHHVTWGIEAASLFIRPQTANGEWLLFISDAHIIIAWSRDLPFGLPILQTHCPPSDFRGDQNKRVRLELADPNLFEQITDTLQLEKWKAE